MTVEGCPRVAKFILIAFNILVLLAGGLAIGLGVWTYTSDYGGDKLREVTGSGLYRGASIAIIVGGCIIAALSFLGCCGAWMENRVMLGIYFIIMLLFLILFVVAAVLGFVYKDTIQKEISNQMEETLINEYSNSTSASDGSKAATSAWDQIQKEFQCCGVAGKLNSKRSWYLWQSSDWFSEQPLIGFKRMVPASCCNQTVTDLSICQKINGNPTQPPQNTPNVTAENPALFSTGCVDKMIDELEKYVGVIAGIAVAVLIVLLLCVIFSVCVCASIGKDGMVV